MKNSPAFYHNKCTFITTTAAKMVLLQVWWRLIEAKFGEIHEKLIKRLQSASFKALLINKRGFKKHNRTRQKKNLCAVAEPFLCGEEEEEKEEEEEGKAGKVCPPLAGVRKEPKETSNKRRRRHQRARGASREGGCCFPGAGQKEKRAAVLLPERQR